MLVVGIVGSPRKGGNTEILVEKVLEGAKSKGAETKMFRINEMKINYCQGCFHCQQYGECKQKDDMYQIYDALKSANAVVVGSPIYMGYVTAQTKTFLDRLLAMLNIMRRESKLAGKKLALIYTQGMGNDGEKVMRSIGERLSNFGMHFVGVVGGNGLNEPGAVKNRKELLDGAFKLGKEL